jgi:molybdopterin-guanine dinucleotide biosynthesis protein A
MTGAILAGGYSRRMGRDKALLPWQGQPLWQRQTAVLRAAGADPVAMVRRADQSELGELCWRDRRSDCGPLAGLEVALEQCGSVAAVERGLGHIAILAVDMPYLEADWFQWLASACAPGVGAVAQHSAAFEPLAAIYPAAALAEVTRRLDIGECSLQALIRQMVADGLMYARVLPDKRLPAARSLNVIA